MDPCLIRVHSSNSEERRRRFGSPCRPCICLSACAMLKERNRAREGLFQELTNEKVFWCKYVYATPRRKQTVEQASERARLGLEHIQRALETPEPPSFCRCHSVPPATTRVEVVATVRLAQPLRQPHRVPALLPAAAPVQPQPPHRHCNEPRIRTPTRQP
jgi:hypothetical protein